MGVLVGVLVLSASAPLARASYVISLGRQAAQPDTEHLGGTPVTVSDGVDVATNALEFTRVSDEGYTQDVDALHRLANGNLLFSTHTFLFSFPDVGTVNPGDVIEYDVGTGTYSVYFSNTNFAVSRNVNAFTVLPNGNALLSTSISASLPGLGTFADGDIVDWDGTTASLFLAESSIFTSGANNSIDGLHYTGDSVLFSVLTDGIGQLGSNGLAYGVDSSDIFEIDPSTTVVSRALDGEALWDSGNTRQTDAVFQDAEAVIPEPTTFAIWALLGILASARCCWQRCRQAA